MQSLRAAGENLTALLDRFLTLPDKELFTADVLVADWKVRLRSTCSKTTDLYSQRIRSRDSVAPHSSTARLTLSLLETSELGWNQSFSGWGDRRAGFESLMKRSGLKGADLSAVEPCTIFDPKRLMGAQVVTNIAD